MREILFRAKKNHSDEWVYGYISFNPTISDYIIDDTINDKYNIPICIATIGQYTGFKDKNSQKIFEGDILISECWDDDIYGTVRYNDDKTEFGIFTTDTSYYGLGNDFYSHNLEIVGNIFDNKTNNLRIRSKSCDDYISKEQALKMFEKHSYPVRYDGNSIEQGMTITGIRQVLNELTLVENTPQKVKGVLSELEIYCPNCSGINIYEITHDNKFIEYSYCPDCGQKLDWSDMK